MLAFFFANTVNRRIFNLEVANRKKLFQPAPAKKKEKILALACRAKKKS